MLPLFFLRHLYKNSIHSHRLHLMFEMKKDIFQIQLKAWNDYNVSENNSDDDANDFHGLNDFMQTKKGDWSSRQRFAQSCSAVFTFALLAKCRVAQQSTCTLVFDFCTGGSGAVHTFHRAWLHWAAAAAGPVLNHTDLHQCNKFTLRSSFRL